MICIEKNIENINKNYNKASCKESLSIIGMTSHMIEDYYAHGIDKKSNEFSPVIGEINSHLYNDDGSLSVNSSIKPSSFSYAPFSSHYSVKVSVGYRNILLSGSIKSNFTEGEHRFDFRFTKAEPGIMAIDVDRRKEYAVDDTKRFFQKKFR